MVPYPRAFAVMGGVGGLNFLTLRSLVKDGLGSCPSVNFDLMGSSGTATLDFEEVHSLLSRIKRLLMHLDIGGSANGKLNWRILSCAVPNTANLSGLTSLLHGVARAVAKYDEQVAAALAVGKTLGKRRPPCGDEADLTELQDSY